MTDEYRVLGRPPGADGLLLAPREGDQTDPDAFAPVAVEAPTGEGEAVAEVDGVALHPGYAIEATLLPPDDGDDGRPSLSAATVERETLLTVADDVDGLYEAATDAFRTARAAGEGMTSRVTRGTDGEPNGALYAFADPPGRDLVAGFRRGRPPVEPLLSRADEGREGDGPMEVFVLGAADEPFVAVHVVFERDGLLANTIRETYDLPRPDAAGGLAGRLDDGDDGVEPDVPGGVGDGFDGDGLDNDRLDDDKLDGDGHDDDDGDDFDLLDGDLPTRD